MYLFFFCLAAGLFWLLSMLVLKMTSASLDKAEPTRISCRLIGLLSLFVTLSLGFFYGKIGLGDFDQLLYLSTVVFLIPAAYWDWRTKTIPNGFIVLGLIVGVGLRFLARLFQLNTRSRTWRIQLILAIGLLCLLIIFRKVSKGGIGYGDIKLLIVFVLFLEPFSLLLCLFLSFALAGLWSIILLLRNKAKAGSKIPFAPFLWGGYSICGFLWPKLVYR